MNSISEDFRECRESSIPLSRYIGIPYKLNGRDESGTDCLGLVWMYLQDQGIFIPDGDGVPVDQSNVMQIQERFIASLDRLGAKVDAPQANDIVLIHWRHQVAHLGVMIDSQRMLHAAFDRTSEVGSIAAFRHRILGFWRIKGCQQLEQL